MTSLRSFRATVALAVGLPLFVALSASASATPAGAATLPTCPLSALTKAKGTVDITFWNSAVRANAQVLAQLTASFNASQHKVHVTLVDQASYDDTFTKYLAGLTNGQLPAVVQLEDQRTQEVMDTRSILPVQSCMNATGYKTSDFLARPLAYWRVNGVQQAMPFAVSNPVLYYNKLAFQKAGLNPDEPPTTLPAMISDAKALKSAGIGTAVKLDPWHLETWLATANQLFVNNKNGRTARATKAAFDSATGRQIFSELDDLVHQAGATTNPATGPSEFDNLLGIGAGKYAMTIDTSASLGTITQVLATGQYPNVQLGVSPFPVLSATRRGGIEPGGSGLFITNKVPPAQQAAAWQFVAYLMNTQSQATWAAGTGYIPVRKSSAASPTVQDLWATSPGYKVAYNQLLNGANTAATSGSVIGPYGDVRTAVLNAEESMFEQGTRPATALSTAARQVNATIASYNQRLGVA
jgi:sn-glycerol 3-phosphate transport system substrate-binding protein